MAVAGGGNQSVPGWVYCAHRCVDHGASYAQKPLVAPVRLAAAASERRTAPGAQIRTHFDTHKHKYTHADAHGEARAHARRSGPPSTQRQNTPFKGTRSERTRTHPCSRGFGVRSGRGFDSLTLQWEGAARSRVFSRHSFTHHL